MNVQMPSLKEPALTPETKHTLLPYGLFSSLLCCVSARVTETQRDMKTVGLKKINRKCLYMSAWPVAPAGNEESPKVDWGGGQRVHRGMPSVRASIPAWCASVTPSVVFHVKYLRRARLQILKGKLTLSDESSRRGRQLTQYYTGEQ